MSSIDFSKPVAVSERKQFGSLAIKKIRSSGFVPASIYDAGRAVHMSIDVKTAKKLSDYESIKTKIITFDIEGKVVKAIAKTFTFCPVKSTVEYIEFISCEGKTHIETLIPINISGRAVSPGIKRNGKINIVKYEVPVLAEIGKIPEEIIVDISKFGLGKTYKSTDVKIDGITLHGEFPILSIIGRGKKDADEETATEQAAAVPAKAAAKPATAKTGK
jgi:large subunit ribosomal protein L25